MALKKQTRVLEQDAEFATGSGVKVVFAINGEADINDMAVTGESIQSETANIKSAQLGSNVVLGRDSIAINKGLSGGVESEVTDSLASQKLLHMAFNVPEATDVLAGGLVINYRGNASVSSVLLEATNLLLKEEGVTTHTLDITGKTINEIITLVNVVDTWGADLLMYYGGDKVPTNLEMMGTDLKKTTTEIVVTGAEGYKSGVLVNRVTSIAKGLLSKIGKPQRATFYKKFDSISIGEKYENCIIASTNFAMEIDGLLKSSITLQGGSGSSITDLPVVTNKEDGEVYALNMRAHQFVGGRDTLAETTAIDINNTTTKFETWQGVSQGAQRTGNIIATVSTTIRYDQNIEENILTPIKRNVEQDYLVCYEIINDAKYGALDYTGVVMFYMQRTKSQTIPAASSTGTDVVTVAPVFEALDPKDGNGVSVFTQGA